jgi:hypothetical protein
MTTEEIMALANALAGLDRTPADSHVYVPGRNIRRVLAGIDTGVGEILAAKQLGYDLVLNHHPLGHPGAWRCYDAHRRFLVEDGVPEEEARAAVAARREEFELRDHVANHDHVASYARLLGMPLLNIHAVADELGRRVLQACIDDVLQGSPAATVGDVCDALESIEEIRNAPTRVEVRVGDRGAPAGRVRMAHGCYTNGGADVAAAYWRHGVRTVCYIHVAAEALAKLRALPNCGNLVVTGHIASDEIGMNILVRQLRIAGLEVDCVSGVGMG